MLTQNGRYFGLLQWLGEKGHDLKHQPPCFKCEAFFQLTASYISCWLLM